LKFRFQIDILAAAFVTINTLVLCKRRYRIWQGDVSAKVAVVRRDVEFWNIFPSSVWKVVRINLLPQLESTFKLKGFFLRLYC
jgi:hypothetical protein